MDPLVFPPDLSLAVVNIGNTRLTMAVCHPVRHLPEPRTGPGALGRVLPDLDCWQGLSYVSSEGIPDPGLVGQVETFMAQNTVSAVVVVSVVPAVSRLLQVALDGLEFVDYTWPLPFTHTIEDLGAVGSDRLVNIAMARAWGLDEALVVDAGTATTFDLLTEGVFRGGLIAPGMAFAAQKLGAHAAQLGQIPFGPCPLAVGRNTREAMGAGAWYTGFHGVRGTIEDLLNTYGSRPVIFTGGLGHLVAGSDDYIDPFWTLRGAAWLWVTKSQPSFGR